MIKSKNISILFLFILHFFFGINVQANHNQYPKNIILLIGDGMGISTISAAKIDHKKLNLEHFKHIGLVSNHSTDHLITDSAASATAMSTGYKTKNRMIAMSPNGKKLETTLEIAQTKHMKTGLVVTSSITHATPASFISHVKSRYLQTEIAHQISKNPPDVIIGGGLGYFLPKSHLLSLRKDDFHLLSHFPNPYQIITNHHDFKKIKNPTHLLALLDQDGLPQASSRKISLKTMTKKAINILSQSKNGFFLMVEGSQIDWMAHDNLGTELVEEMIDFDDAIGAALRFQKSNPNTLILVTADHETGGFGITQASKNKIKEFKFLSKEHTSQLVPIFSSGPQAEKFTGFLDNTDIGKMMIEIIRTK